MNYLSFLLFFFLVQVLYAQTPFEEGSLFEFSSNEEMIQKNAEAIENLSVFIKNPININKADESVLMSLGFLKEEQIREILDYVNSNKPLVSLYELQILPSMNAETFQWMKACFTTENNDNNIRLLKNIIGSDRSMLLIRYAPALTDADKTWTGNADKLSIRFQTQVPNKMRIGFSMEKDAGEQICWLPGQRYYGFDNLNAYIRYTPSPRWKQITIGTYRLQFGQGVLIGGGFFAGKGSETVTTLRKAPELVLPVGSTTEYGRFFGISSTYAITSAITLTGFLSRTHEDATFNNEDQTILQSMTETGYHRTANELANRKQIITQVCGYHLRFKRKTFSIGHTAFFRHIPYPVIPDSSYYNQFYARKKNSSGASIDVQHQYQNYIVFGEAAFTNSGGVAVLAGVLAALSKKADFSLLYRNYSKVYRSPYAQAFGESSTNNNEKGIYAGIKIRPGKQWSIHAYADLFVFPWLRYRVHMPSEGEEYFFRMEYKPNKRTTYYFQQRYEDKYQDISGTALITTAIRSTSVLYMEHKVSLALSLRTRLQWGYYDNTLQRFHGSLFAQDIIFKQRKYQCTVRWMWYDVEDYNARQYAYEPDMPYSFYIPAYNGKAIKPMIMIRYTLIKNIDLWMKAAITKPMKQYTSDQNALITTPALIDWHWQLRWIF